ncbi:hypothetical protein R3P38DRAFT_3200593 [Favolaschia claudopus]|uniref:Uncharacterized protein n=1 Tax=Favolaschia claudopus TaxID=2862362 RepID=A0AAW0AY07_9AGAR
MLETDQYTTQAQLFLDPTHFTSHPMFSTRFIALLVASVATLALAKPTAAVAPAPDASGDTIFACVDLNFGGNCDTVAFLDGLCVQMPGRQVNEMSSVQVPAGWACTFYDAKSSTPCDPDTGSNTLLHAPGSPRLSIQNFNDVVDFVKCTQLCV